MTNLVDAIASHGGEGIGDGIRDFLSLLPAWQQHALFLSGGAFLGVEALHNPSRFIRGVAATVGVGAGVTLGYVGAVTQNPEAARQGADILIGFTAGLWGYRVLDQARR